MGSYIRDGIEFFDVEIGTEAQCARCGSSTTYVDDESLDGSGYEGHVCLSDAEWCDSNPLPGREQQVGGHGRPVPTGAADTRTDFERGKAMRVLVCGGRDFSDRDSAYRTLDAIHAETPISVIIEGGASGADRLAFQWASEGNRCGTLTFDADWNALGKAAGPMRNWRMLNKGKPDVVVAFPGGRGTADMVRRAKKAGVRVVVVDPKGEVKP